MARKPLSHAILIVVILGARALGATAAETESTTPGSCPGYVSHLRSARTYLARGDRKAATTELRQAEQALDSCAHGNAGSNAVAKCPASRVAA